MPFNSTVSKELANAGLFSFKVDPVAGGNGSNNDWGAITLGASDNALYGASGAGAVGQSILATATDYGVLFRDNGGFQAFDSSTQVGSGTYSSSPTTIVYHDIQFLISGANGSNSLGGGKALIQVFADDGTTPFLNYTETGGFADNFSL